MSWTWTREQVLGLAQSFQGSCVLVAAAELGLFDALAGGPLSAEVLAERLHADVRATRILADALATVPLLTKDGQHYALQPGVAELLTEKGSRSCLAMVRHQANCLRSWAQLAKVTRTGRPAARVPSIRGPAADLANFIQAMDQFSQAEAPRLVKALGPPAFRHLLDVGGGSGTWTEAFLQTSDGSTATLFDQPEVIPLARKRLAEAGLADRVVLVPGDFSGDDPLPAGADLAWVSAVSHMGSRADNRRLFGKIHAALADDGRLLVRDIVMDDSRTAPAAGALFAVNMLVHNPGGGTYTFQEFREDLQSAGFHDPVLLHRGELKYSVIRTSKS